tara:strand:- start:48 stop:464 length:417 start_codon:yes stop_codon:yes gene_type:complete
MFGKSYSKKSIDDAASLVVRIDRIIENQLQTSPVKGIPFNYEFQPIKLFPGKEKRNKAKIRSLFNSGVLYALLEIKFDGKNKDFFKYAKKVLYRTFNYGLGIRFGKMMYKSLLRDSQDTYEPNFRKGYKWGQSLYEKL